MPNKNPILFQQHRRSFNRAPDDSHTIRDKYNLRCIVMVLLFFLLMVAMASANTASGSAADVNIFSAIATEPPIQVQCKLANLILVLPEQTVEYGHHVGFGFKPNIWGTTRYNCDFKWGDRWQSFDVWVDDIWWSYWLKRPCLHCLWIVSEDGFFREKNGSGDQHFAHSWK